ncbi:MAG: response regulator transcription factor [Acidobacteria bacterium]|nr:response regulator transcription factor [Acidobacteriota bacterium]
MLPFALIESNPALSRRLGMTLRTVSGVKLVADYASVMELETALRERATRRALSQCEFALLGLNEAHAQDLRALRQVKLRVRHLIILGLVHTPDPAVLLPALQAGVDGFLSYPSAAPQLLALLEADTSLRAAAATTVVDWLRATKDTAFRLSATPVLLTQRERDVLCCLVRGLSYQLAAAQLGISLDTARSHIKSVYKKLGVNSAAQAVAYALRYELC